MTLVSQDGPPGALQGAMLPGVFILRKPASWAPGQLLAEDACGVRETCARVERPSDGPFQGPTPPNGTFPRARAERAVASADTGSCLCPAW